MNYLIKSVFTLFLLVLPVFVYAEGFNNVPITSRELNLDIERSVATAALDGFTGIKPYTKAELINVYGITKDEYLYKYISKDLIDLGMSPEGKTSSEFYIEPLSEIKFRAYTFNTDVPGKTRYCLENMEGTCLDKGLTTFLNVAGQGRLNKNITFFYEGQVRNSSEGTDTTLKKAYVKLRTGIVSWELGKDSIWLGHGYHGSLLLSNNADPFLMFKFDTEEPFRLPFFLSKLGEFKYTFFHGWLTDFNIIGQRIAWKPFSILEFGANQTATYDNEKDYKITDWPNILFSAEDNVAGAKYNNDQRGSLDVALYMPFLSKIPYLGLTGGKLYAEYGGEDVFAWWQEEDKTWYGPFGFEFLAGGYMAGIYLTTGKTDFRFEHAENYITRPLFYDWYTEGFRAQWGVDAHRAFQNPAWYRSIPFTYHGVILGHHMGPEGEDNYFEVKHRIGKFTITASYDRERHRIYETYYEQAFKVTPEKRKSYGIDVLYSHKQWEVNVMAFYNKYENVDANPDPLKYEIKEGLDVDELVAGVGIKYLW